MFPALDPGTALAPRYWSWNGGPREGRGVEAMEKGGQIVGAGGAGGGWECLGTPWKPELRTWGGDRCPKFPLVG